MSLVTKKAPDFKTSAVVGDGDFKEVSLSDYKGKYVVLFFYPADFTFICPTEIQEFSRRYEEFRALNCEILGASTDSKHSHKAWIKQGLGKLNHPLLADFNKTFFPDLRRLEPDWVVVDLVDERFDVLRTGDSFVTESSAFAGAGLAAGAGSSLSGFFTIGGSTTEAGAGAGHHHLSRRRFWPSGGSRLRHRRCGDLQGGGRHPGQDGVES